MDKSLIKCGDGANTELSRLVGAVGEMASAESQTPSIRSRVLGAAPIRLTTVQCRAADLSENAVDLEQVRPNHPQFT